MTISIEDLSKKDLIEILELLDSCIKYQYLGDQREIALFLSNSLSIRNVFFSIGKLDPQGKLLSEKLQILEMSLYFPDCKDLLYINSDLSFKEYLKNFSMQAWLESFIDIKDRTQITFIKESNISKSINCITVGVFDSKRGQAGLFSFVCKDQCFDQKYIDVIRYITPYIYEAFSRDSPVILDIKTKLTVREKEALRWAVLGKTNWEISRILNVSESAIKHHFKNMYVKLSASNRAHVVAIALAQNFI